MHTPEEIIKIKEAAETALFRIPGVTMVAVGQKQAKGKLTGDISILVYVEQKKPEAALIPEEIIPAEINGVKTDIIESGRMRNLGAHRGGEPVESSRGGSGTLGCFAFTTEATPRAVLLTNQHVLMQGTTTSPLGEETGSLICSFCSPCCSKVIGNVLQAVVNSAVDAATAVLKPGVQLLPEIESIGVVRGVHPLTSTEGNSGSYAVKIYSRQQSTITNGIVQGLNGSGDSMQHNHTLHRHYTNQVVIQSTTAFCIPGDSGSVVLNSNNEVIGLLSSANDTGTITIACPIADVQSQMHIRIATASSPGQVYTVPGAASGTTAGEPVDMNAVLIGGMAVQPEFLQEAHQKILSTAKGRLYDKLYHKHMVQVRTLVNTNKRVATVWHRNNGPAWLVHFSNSLRDKRYRIPATVRSMPLTELFKNMAAILTRFGNQQLQDDIAEHLPDILAYAVARNNAGEFISALINQDEQCLTAQGH